MKLTNKRLWKGEKAEYYPAFKYALTDSLLFSVLWVVIISLLLSTICLIIHFTNGSNMSWEVIAFVLLFLSTVFLISNGMFLYENWYKQERTMGKQRNCYLKVIAYRGLNMMQRIRNTRYKCVIWVGHLE